MTDTIPGLAALRLVDPATGYLTLDGVATFEQLAQGEFEVATNPSVDAVALTTSAAAIASAVNETRVIEALTACNTTGSARTIDVHIVASGGAASASNQVFSAAAIGANATVDLTAAEGHLIPQNGTVQAIADGDGVTVTMTSRKTT